MTIKKIKIAVAAAIFAAAIFAVAFAQNVFAQQTQSETLKFDDALQTDFAAAMGGDAAALTRAMQRAEKVLAANPNDAETLAWHGSATLANAGKAFQNGDFKAGYEQWQKGLAEMDKAVELSPDSFVVRIVRGSTYLSASKKFPDPQVAKDLRAKGIGDYEKILSLTDEKSIKMAATQKPRIFNGLIEAYDKTGDKTKADSYRAALAKIGK